MIKSKKAIKISWACPFKSKSFFITDLHITYNNKLRCTGDHHESNSLFSLLSPAKAQTGTGLRSSGKPHACFKGTVSRDFRLMFFSANNTRGSHDSRSKAESNIDSYLRRYSTKKIRSRLHSAESIIACKMIPKSILFYCHGIGATTNSALLKTTPI
jgi:hypothetical protein